jgi:glycosyltransferase involved in cell wall biosynthesis
VNPCLLIPIYNHGETIAGVLASLAGLTLPCLIIDDGSDAATRHALASAIGEFPWVTVERLPANRGRGAALRRGYQSAWTRGYSHVVQLDADGQHDAADVPRFLAAAREDAAALVLGAPIFDATAPWSRLAGRQLSRFWVHVETLSHVIHDPLCGFRCLPLRLTVDLLSRARCGDRMEFDPEIVVRWAWEGWRIVNLPTRVRYFPSGLSHFRPLDDNARITWAHTRLVVGMLWRLVTHGPGLSTDR